MKRNNAILNPVITWIIAIITMAGIILGVLYAKESREASLIEKLNLFSCDFFATLKNSIISSIKIPTGCDGSLLNLVTTSGGYFFALPL